ncbi:2-methylisocitrate lyase-like PEP mutase family enzyme [Pseudonocardia hierapolitana]|uniref:2-methylisocitrate lyase-like PEP mutase family enzyme n=1 Tax=Pseudonocardia hierapolitana TaxID=1128676 RepID=A0A561T400_9PSEU|nr:isocitrate lyase/phosphoenolpyruvate mutase family protein [Pseudonocardia hierapolitana]TWF81837.1 2-methylisocitrate lyase-like PEP mutase family enzyme [Pseudonocardia hierapolitana]
MTSSDLTGTDMTARFRALHVPGDPLLMPNPWDEGSAKALATLGFAALATTSSGFAATAGLVDGAVGAVDTLEHAAAVALCVDIPVSADLEDGWGDDPGEVASTVAEAVESGLAGCSIEDYSAGADPEIHDIGLAAERIAAAADAAQEGRGLVLTARAENFIRGNPDLGDTIERLQAYQEAGAEVLYAPGLVRLADIRSLVSSVDRPVNVLLMPGMAPIEELADAGVARISVGGTFSAVAFGALARAARELKEQGTYGFFELAREGRELTTRAFRLH